LTALLIARTASNVDSSRRVDSRGLRHAGTQISGPQCCVSHAAYGVHQIGPSAQKVCRLRRQDTSSANFPGGRNASARDSRPAHCRSPTGPEVGLRIGASIDFLTGKQRRAPVWLQKIGLEWLYRLLSDPRRLASRYLIECPRILYLIYLKSNERYPTSLKAGWARPAHLCTVRRRFRTRSSLAINVEAQCENLARVYSPL
jgi:Glycosyl transferase WecG/TagA/CpsF family